jgi:hypothetical protein
VICDKDTPKFIAKTKRFSKAIPGLSTTMRIKKWKEGKEVVVPSNWCG